MFFLQIVPKKEVFFVFPRTDTVSVVYDYNHSMHSLKRGTVR